MAVGTDFSVTKKATKPVVNPVAPVDKPGIIGSETAGQISGPYPANAKASQAIDSPDPATAQAPQTLYSPDLISGQAQASLDAPVVLTANAGTLTTPPFPLNHARILYNNLLVDSTPSATISSGIARFALIPNTHQRWSFTSSSTESITFTLPANVSMDTFCIGSHNLFNEIDGSTPWKFSYSSATSGAFSPLSGFITPVDNAAGMIHVSTPVSVRRLQLELQSSTIREKFIGYISAGIALQMQRPFFSGHTPINDSDVTEYYHNRTESGEIIGQMIRRQGYKTNAEWKNLNDEWYRTYFAPFKRAAKLNPFFFAWNLSEYPLDVGFCRIAKDISAPYQGQRTLRSLSMELLGAG